MEGLQLRSSEAASAIQGREFSVWSCKRFGEPHGHRTVTYDAVGADTDGNLAEGEGGG
jgi:hypothetical protein